MKCVEPKCEQDRNAHAQRNEKRQPEKASQAEALRYAKAGERDDQPPQVLVQIDVEFVLNRHVLE